MKLPYRTRCRIDREKITRYLLCGDHADGRTKAAFFERFGFSAENWEECADALRLHGGQGEVVRRAESEYGVRYTVEGPLSTPSGRTPTIHTVWIVEAGSDVPRLITAYPA